MSKAYENLLYGIFMLACGFALGVLVCMQQKEKTAKPTPKPVVRKPIEEPQRKPKRVLTDSELEEMASHKEREGIGANFYYHELRLRKEAKWAKEELERRKAGTQ